MKNKIVLLLCFCLCIGQLMAQKIQGVYVREDFRNEELVFSGKSFLYKWYPGRQNYFNCNDTLAYGTWELGNSGDFLKLYSNDFKRIDYAIIDVVESVGYDADSIYIYVNSPLERSYPGEFYYSLSIDTGNSEIDNKYNKQYGVNKMVLPASGFGVKDVQFIICPKDPYHGVKWMLDRPPFCVTTVPYKAKDNKSNVFNINVPELTACYMSSLRLNGDFVKVLSSKRLEWDGHIYRREGSD